MGDLEPAAFADPGKGMLAFLFAKTMGLHVFVELWSISLKGPTRFQRRGPLKSAERSDEAIFNCLP